jgi:heparosan-N-sulfate-glucuronate 5-epimerase
MSTGDGVDGRPAAGRSRLTQFLSLTFNQPLGTRVADGGYHLDLRVKVAEPQWPAPDLLPLDTMIWVGIAQWGLGAVEHFVHEHDERWLTAARGAADHVLAHMVDGGPLDGALPHVEGFAHTFTLAPGWISAMAQGEAASLLVRVHRFTGDDRYAAAARRLLGPIAVHSRDGGCGVPWAGGWWPEEYPTEPPSFVLNGGVFAILGLADVAAALGDERAQRLFDDTLGPLAANVRLWDLGWWSRYDLYPHAAAQGLPHVASLGYHILHEDLLRALDRVRPTPALRAQADRFAAERGHRLSLARAMAAKVAFRLAVPRTSAAR